MLTVFSPMLLCVSAVLPAGEPGNATNRVNPGWYGWFGDFHDIRGYYRPECDVAYLRRHHVNWVWLGHQWVVPYLETGAYNVRDAIVQNKGRIRFWYELYWWGDHSVWSDAAHPMGFAIGHIPPPILQKLVQSGIRPGGCDLRGKDWLAVADAPQVMAGVKQTIQWQLDTILRHCGTDALYGVVLSEEEPDHGVGQVLGQAGGARYWSQREEVIPKLARVHNELFDFIKQRYPQLKVAPGFYPAWVRPGTLKMDAAVMDLYPAPGEELKAVTEWEQAYGAAPEHYILLWGHGDRGRRLECTRFDNTVRLLLGRGRTNLGFFAPALALEDRVLRLYDVDGIGDYGPYDAAAHRDAVAQLHTETSAVVEALTAAGVSGLPPLPVAPDWLRTSSPTQPHAGPPERPLSGAGGTDPLRAELQRLTVAIYDFRELALDSAWTQLERLKDLQRLGGLSALLAAEGLAAPDARPAAASSMAQLRDWEALAKEFGTLPRFYAQVLPVQTAQLAAARALAAQLRANTGDLGKRLTGEPGTKSMAVATRAAAALEAGQVAAAETGVRDVRQALQQAGVERSWGFRVVCGNHYGKPLNVRLTLTAEYPGGATAVVYSDYPCTTAEATAELELLLPAQPVAIRLTTSPWSGDLRIDAWVVRSSRGVLQPRQAVDIDHVTGAEEFATGVAAGFTLAPWASIAGVRFLY